MIQGTIKISKEVFDNAKDGYIANEDMSKVFDICTLMGYGVYGAKVYKENGEYFCRYYRGETCD